MVLHARQCLDRVAGPTLVDLGPRGPPMIRRSMSETALRRPLFAVGTASIPTISTFACGDHGRSDDTPLPTTVVTQEVDSTETTDLVRTQPRNHCVSILSGEWPTRVRLVSSRSPGCPRVPSESAAASTSDRAHGRECEGPEGSSRHRRESPLYRDVLRATDAAACAWRGGAPIARWSSARLVMMEFVIARQPDPASSLPYPIRLPRGPDGIALDLIDEPEIVDFDDEPMTTANRSPIRA